MTSNDDDRVLSGLLADHIPQPPEGLYPPPPAGALAARLRRRRSAAVALAAAAVVLVTAAGYGVAGAWRVDGSAPAAPPTPAVPPRAEHPLFPIQQLDTSHSLLRTGAAVLDVTGRTLTVPLDHRQCDYWTLTATATANLVRLGLTGTPVQGDCDKTRLSDLTVTLPEPLGERQVLDPLGHPVQVTARRAVLRPSYLPPSTDDRNPLDGPIDGRIINTPGMAGAGPSGWHQAYLGQTGPIVVIDQCGGQRTQCGDSDHSTPLGSTTVRGHPGRLGLATRTSVNYLPPRPPVVLTWNENGYTFSVSVNSRELDRPALIHEAQLVAESLR